MSLQCNQVLDIEASLHIAALIGAEPNACWSNAWDEMVDSLGYFASSQNVPHVL